MRNSRFAFRIYFRKYFIFLVCSPWMMKISSFIIEIISKSIVLMIRIITTPIRILYRLDSKTLSKNKEMDLSEE